LVLRGDRMTGRFGRGGSPVDKRSAARRISWAKAAGSVKGVMCAAPGRTCRGARGRRPARADMAAGVETWSSPAAMRVAGALLEALRPARSSAAMAF
jgi:hypothetical protein